jgi:hypothetical protein
MTVIDEIAASKKSKRRIGVNATFNEEKPKQSAGLREL